MKKVVCTICLAVILLIAAGMLISAGGCASLDSPPEIETNEQFSTIDQGQEAVLLLLVLMALAVLLF